MSRKKNHDNYDYFQQITPEGITDVVKQEEPANIAEEPEKEPSRYHFYEYRGPVHRFGKCVISHFEAETSAVSEAKARQNILFRAKKQLGLLPSAGGFKLINAIKCVR